jgi:hypothetical protein
LCARGHVFLDGNKHENGQKWCGGLSGDKDTCQLALGLTNRGEYQDAMIARFQQEMGQMLNNHTTLFHPVTPQLDSISAH